MASKEEIFNYVMNTPRNTNGSVLKSMLNSIEDGGEAGAKSVEEILIYDGDQNDNVFINSNEFIVQPAPSSGSIEGVSLVVFLTYTDINDRLHTTKHICTLTGSVSSSVAGNIAGYSTDTMPYNKPVILMSNQYGSNNSISAIKIENVYMGDTSKPMHVTIYKLQ